MNRAQEYNQIAQSIVDHYENGTTSQANTTLSVPVSHYTDPARWSQEIERIFKRVPLMLAMTCEMKEPGAYKALEMAGVPVLLTRSKDGKPRAFINACTHRGAPIAADGHGSQARFSCPYHGWTFSNDGHLIGIADKGKFGDADPDAMGLTELPCDERVGFIFVVLTPGEEIDLDKWLGGLIDDLAPYHVEDWYYHNTLEITGANWKIAYDGYLEGYHFTALHPDTIASVSINNLMDFQAYGPHLRTAYGETNIEELKDVPKEEWHTRENNGFSFVRTLFPNISIYLGLGLGQIAQIAPGPTPGENRTFLNFVHPTPPKDEAEKDGLDETMHFLRDVVRDEDYDLNFKIQRGLQANPFENITFGRNEQGNQYFHKWVDYYLDDDPKAQPPTL